MFRANHRGHALTGGRARLFVILGALAIFALGLGAGALWQTEIRGSLGVGEPPREARADASEVKDQLWTCGMHPQVIQDRPGTCPICGMALTPVHGTGATATQKSGARTVKYWWDPMMSPPYISDQPGKSPMGMDLVPVYEDEVSAGSALTIDPTVVQNMGLRVTTAQEAPLSRKIRAVGILREPDPARHDVNLRVDGWIDRLHAGTEGMRLAKGDPLFDLYSPELQVAVEELIGARRLRETGGIQAQAQSIYDSAVRKLELFGVSDNAVKELAALERAPHTVTFRSPADGFLVERMVFAGSAVKAGDTVMRIANTSKLWVDVRVFEKDLSHVRLGQAVSASVDGRSGESFRGAVVLVHPRIDPTTRTALVRLEIENPEFVLRQGMFATAQLTVEIAERALIVPREAVIDTGSRQVAFVARDMGHFEPRNVAMGALGDDGLVQVLSGLAPGEQVVVSGQFLLDAESRMKEAIQKFLQQKTASAPPASKPLHDEPPQRTGAALGALSEPWLQAADAALAAYLSVAAELGAPQSSDAPIDLAGFVAASRTLRERAEDDSQSSLASALTDSVTAMQNRPLAEQRKLFKPVSDAAIALAERSPRETTKAPATLFVAHCPMVSARWLQANEEIANPYYATTMKSCGEIERRVTAPAMTGDSGTRPRGGKR